MLRNFIVALCLITWASPIWALCDGEGYLARLSDAQRDRLIALRADIPHGDGLIWTATRGADTVTLIGTLHIYDPRLADIMDDLGRTIAATDILLVEATPREEAQMQAALADDPSQLFLPDGQTLPDLLDDATWDQLIVAARDRGIPPFLMSKFQPWYVMMTLAIPPCAMGDLAAGKRGLDHMIMARADEAGIPKLALEPFDTLFSVFRTGTVQDQLNMLKISILTENDQQAMFVTLLDDYFAGQIGQIFALNQIVAERLNVPDAVSLVRRSEQALLFDRNVNWMPIIEAATDTHDDVVVAVGAAHLAGTQGLVALLRRDGWTVTRR